MYVFDPYKERNSREGRRSFPRRCAYRRRKDQEVGPCIEHEGAFVVDAEGRYVVPGGVDPHTHVSLVSAGRSVSDGFEAATKAAIWGGTTTIVEHPGFVSEGSSLSLAVDDTLKRARALHTDFGCIWSFRGRTGLKKKMSGSLYCEVMQQGRSTQHTTPG